MKLCKSCAGVQPSDTGNMPDVLSTTLELHGCQCASWAYIQVFESMSHQERYRICACQVALHTPEWMLENERLVLAFQLYQHCSRHTGRCSPPLPLASRWAACGGPTWQSRSSLLSKLCRRGELWWWAHSFLGCGPQYLLTANMKLFVDSCMLLGRSSGSGGSHSATAGGAAFNSGQSCDHASSTS